MATEEQKKTIQDDIFSITGQKLDAEDPVVIAALFYSAKLREAYSQNGKALEKICLSAQENLDQVAERTIENLKLALIAQQKESGVFYQKMAEQLKASVQSEVPKIKSELSDYKRALQRKISEQILKPSSLPHAYSLLGIIFVVAIASGAIGAVWFGKSNELSIEDKNTLAMGHAITQAIPMLDKQTKDKLTKLLEENAQRK